MFYADGTYQIVRSIDIDPPVNGEHVWINYGREFIGSFEVRNNYVDFRNLNNIQVLVVHK